MFLLLVVGLLMLVLSFGFGAGPDARLEHYRASAEAANFLVWREAAIKYTIANPAETGTISLSELTPYLPDAYQPMQNWRASVGSYGLLVYSTEYRLQTPVLVEQMLGYPMNVGITDNGEILSAFRGDVNVPLPSWVADDTLVALIEKP